MVSQQNERWTIKHYLNNMSKLTENVFEKRTRKVEPQRLYLKDIDCPRMWQRSLESIIPPFLFYLNEFPKRYAGPGSKYSDMPPYPQTKDSVPIAKAGDLMSSLPEDMRAENLMCYIGHEGTYTAAHQEMCGTLSHNLMVEASDGTPEDGKPTRPGSSIWLMTETHDRDLVSEYWRSMLGHDLDLEAHFAQLGAWQKAPFTTYVVEQTPGDLVLVPPLSVQQVWNRGTRTMKVAWNRTTVETLRYALDGELSRARAVCREEQYKNKAIIYYSLEKYSKLLQQDLGESHPGVDTLWEDFELLFSMYTDVLLSESFSEKLPRKAEYLKFTSVVTCSYCRCNIFNRFLTCPSCVDGEETYDVCMDCYVFGRSCRCISKLKWVEQFHWKDLEANHEKWRVQIMNRIKKQGEGRDHPVFADVRASDTRKSAATICQEQLRVRPWVDCNSAGKEVKPVTPSESGEDESEEVHTRRSAKRRKPNKTQEKRVKKKAEDMGRCHTCKQRPLWTLKKCTTCDLQFCYGCLFRLFDMAPEQIEQFLMWQCPKCQQICSCASCNKKGNKTMNPYLPKKLLLGHDTLKFADERSVESLVDLRQSNAGWMKKFQRTKNHFYAQRFEQLKSEAEKTRMALDETRGSPVKQTIVAEQPADMPFDHELDQGQALKLANLADFPEINDDSLIREEYESKDFTLDPALHLSDTFMAVLDPALGCI